MRLGIVLFFFVVLPSFSALGQNQLILFHRERILARFAEGDDFIYKLKKEKKYKKSFITEVREFSVITFNDTILFQNIDRISLKGHPQKRFSLLSKLFLTAGIGYFLIDQFNNVVVHGNKAELDPAVWKPSLALTVTGLALKYIHKTSQRIRHPARLVMAPRGTKFYKSDE